MANNPGFNNPGFREHDKKADAVAKAADDRAVLVNVDADAKEKAVHAGQTEHDKEVDVAARAAGEQAAKDKAAASAAEAKAKAAHIVAITGGMPCKGIGNSCGDDGVVIPRDGVFTVALIATCSLTTGHHPGDDVNCVARLPDKSEIGDVVEVYVIVGLNGGSAFVHPPKGESIGILPVSTGDNGGTGVEVPPDKGRRFAKISAASWQVLGG